MLINASYAYTDYALALAFSRRHLDEIDIDISYDSACSFDVKAKDRFTAKHPDKLHLIQKARFSIDALHVIDHKDLCMYFYSAAYQVGSGHFHGSGTEQYWSENNQMAGQTKQMNSGNRHDKIIEHHNYWNWKKTTRTGE